MDRYTKVVLTVIAVFLGIVVARDIPFGREALAANRSPSYVAIVGVYDCEDATYSNCQWDPISTTK